MDSATPRGPYGAGAKSVQVAALSDPATDRPAYAPPPQQPAYQAKPFGKAKREPGYTAEAPKEHPAQFSRGEMIEVKPGDTIYGLSRRHRVSLAGLMSVNNLSNPNLKPGQKLYLPTENAPAVASKSSAAAASAAVESARPAPIPLAQASPDVAARYSASYTVKPGDSLYGIARTYKAKFSELQQVNGITDPRRVKPGMTLRVPGGAAGDTSNVANAAPAVSSPPSVASAQPALPPAATAEATSEPPRLGDATTMQPTIINGEKRVASLSDKATDASPVVPPVQPSAPQRKPDVAEQKVAIAAPPPSSAPAAASATGDSVKLRWPTSGKVIAGFGSRTDGTHNDGINLQVPLGTEVHAAESGVVAYAGNELKGYGNLVLLRHDNGWVTAYAHNDELLVKRGDKVRRGQVIAKAGKTGSVDQPQVHFELRQGSRPVDPIPYLEKL
ncbi:LysM peptidoglycan-binding domain-containing M23 family metallopeptidase [Hyphomicrobium sp.]|uniref:LysM peptidoglycan-binding domain-containing M23 family metallopeptidase n=1 Tax=Hyphomicrobium sp. TaxID=82 RepID=UPI0025C20217|nr:LysM peptidoglycan-binding domain-containing M23 family metallopeptidase [Hyphomicrobium sp.]